MASFTRVLISKAMSLLLQHFEEDILRLFRHVLTSLYFNFAGQIYKQTKFFIEDFEERVLNWATHEPLCWFNYVDDTFVIWPHGPNRLRHFLDHLQSVHQRIQLTTETAIFPSWTKIFTGDPMALWAKRYTVNLPIATST
jgi:hypothetical protein